MDQPGLGFADGLGLTVLLNLVAHDALLAGGLVKLEEEACLLITVMFFNQPVPGERVGDEVREVRLL
jgi:hypothetical protein